MKAHGFSHFTVRHFVFIGALAFSSDLPAQDWTRTSAPLQFWSGVACSDDGTRILAASRFADTAYHPGGLYLSTNSGGDWQLSSAPVQFWDRVFSSADGTKLAASGANTEVYPQPAHIYLSTDAGASWAPSSAPAAVWVGLTGSSDARRLVGAVWAGGLFYSSDSGATWTQSDAPPRYWQGLASSADGKRLAASGGDLNFPNNRQVYLSSDGGVTWTPADSSPTTLIALTGPADASRWFGVAGQTGIYLCTNSSQEWQLSTAPTEWEGLAIASSADGQSITAVGISPASGSYGPGPIYSSRDSGKTWRASGTARGYFNSVACSRDGTRWVAAEGGYAPGYIYTFQTAPNLSIQLSGTNLLLSWPTTATAFTLQQSLSPGSVSGWMPVTNTPIISGSSFQTLIPRNAPTSFYRLIAQ